MALHILLIDADASAAQITGAIVQRAAPEGQLTIEASPISGWRSAQQQPPDVLIIDPAPHTAAGTRMIQLCKEHWPSLRVIVLASAPTPALRAQIQSLGVNLYLEKPVPLAAWGERLGHTLRGEPPAAPSTFSDTAA